MWISSTAHSVLDIKKWAVVHIKISEYMVKIIDKGGEAFTPCPAGNHAARVCEVVFIGTVTDTFKGVTKETPQIRISFEIPSELRDDGKPYVVSTWPMTASTNKKAKFYTWCLGITGEKPGKDFESDTLLGQMCLVNVIHKADKNDANVLYADITGASPLPKGMEVPAAINAPLNFDVNTSSKEDFDNLPEFLRKKIELTPEWKARNIF
jgi:hypothetical protein